MTDVPQNIFVPELGREMANPLSFEPGGHRENAQRIIDEAIARHRLQLKVGAARESRRAIADRRCQEVRREEMAVVISVLGCGLNRTPSAADMREYGISTSHVAKLFGSIAAAQAAAGFTPNQPGRPYDVVLRP